MGGLSCTLAYLTLAFSFPSPFVDVEIVETKSPKEVSQEVSMTTKALVLGGGNVDGIYAGAGVAVALQEIYGSLDVFDRLSGTSAGALVSTAIATGKFDSLVQTQHTLDSSQVSKSDKPFSDLRRARRLVSQGHLVDTTPLKALLAREFPDELLASVPAGRLSVTTFDLRRRKTFDWAPEDFANRGDFRHALYASMMVPFATEAVRILHDGELYELVDGGVTAVHPTHPVIPHLWKAKQEGEDVEMVVVSTQDFPNQPKDIPPCGTKRLFRMLKQIKGGFLIEQSNTDFDRADEVGIRQHWIQVDTPDYDLSNFGPADNERAFYDGYNKALLYFQGE